MADLDGALQHIADKQHLHSQIDAMGPLDYAVLIRWVHDDDKGQTGHARVTRSCFAHVAIGLMEEAKKVALENEGEVDE